MESPKLRSLLDVLDSFVSEIGSLNRDPLGPSFSSMTSTELHESLVSHRVLKRWEVPDATGAALRKQYSIEEVITRDKNGLRDFDYRKLPTLNRHDFLRSQQYLRDLFKGFRHEYNLRFPSGETYVGARGAVDLVYKLQSLDQWLISPDVVDYVVEILLRHRALCAVVKQRFKQKYGEQGREALEKIRLQHILHYPEGSVQALRRSMVKYQLRACCVLVRASRVTTVPKDNRRDRVITCEPLWTMVAQLSFAASLRSHLKRRLGIDLDSLQAVHRALVRSGKATIDLSAASDSNYMCVLKALWPTHMYKYLERLRTGIFELSDGEYHPLCMFAPMGCGCTFEVMTITLLAHCRVLDAGSSVFGDDIIIEQEQALRLINNLEAMGWKINTSKSFIAGNFRESCGAFGALDTQQLLVSYDFVRPTDLAGVYTVCHKMWQIGHALPRGAVREVFVKYYAALCCLIARDSFAVGDAQSVRPTAGLVDGVFYAPAAVVRNRLTQRKTSATAALSKYWQRPIGVTNYHTRLARQDSVPPHADRTWYAAFMRRGSCYAPLTGAWKSVTLQVDSFSGTPIRAVQLFTVI